MDRTLFLGKDVEEWFEGFEAELREKLVGSPYADRPVFKALNKLIKEILEGV